MQMRGKFYGTVMQASTLSPSHFPALHIFPILTLLLILKSPKLIPTHHASYIRSISKTSGLNVGIAVRDVHPCLEYNAALPPTHVEGVRWTIAFSLTELMLVTAFSVHTFSHAVRIIPKAFYSLAQVPIPAQTAASLQCSSRQADQSWKQNGGMGWFSWRTQCRRQCCSIQGQNYSLTWPFALATLGRHDTFLLPW